APEAQPLPEAPPAPEPPAETPLEVQPSGQSETPPKAADIVAPDPTDAPAPAPETAPEAAPETTPEPTAEPQPPEPQTPAAPQDTGQVLRTEDTRDQTQIASAAPATSPRPRSKPEKPVPAPEPTPEPARAETPAPAPEAPAAEDAVAGALAEALSGEASDTPAPGTGTAASGPPMTGGEKDALVIAVKGCWNVGALSTDALRTVVTIGVSMDPSGKPVGGSIRMIGYEGGDDASARQAYEAGRRAILRCGQNGYPLPAEKYDQWKDVEITFDPEKMRMK
ncbi:MAG: hypothetical protein KDD88_10610, partial [Rhodobacteraceae bacterium]|nr:hypothetical protein [Paracoccaceae bacterium]